MLIYKTIIMALTVLIFTGCSNSMMQIEEKKQLVILNEKSTIKVTGKNIQKRSLNLSSLYVDQYTLKAEDGSCLVYEEVQTADGYSFAFNDKQTIKSIFDTVHVDAESSFGKLTFYRLQLRDKERSQLTVLVLMDSMQSIKLLYGFDESVYRMFKQGLTQDNAVVEYVVGSSTNHTPCFQNRWSDSLVVVNSLVQLDE